MRIKNIDQLKRNINQSTIIIFIAIFSSVLIAMHLIHNKFVQKQALLSNQEIVSTINIYKSNLSENLSIIASSTAFLDYLRSGRITRQRLYFQFLSQMSSLKSKSISGVQVLNSSNDIIFDYGHPSDFFIILKLCYLNQTLESDMGECRFAWKLFFKRDDLLNEILSINKSMRICNNCNKYSLTQNNRFGSFPIRESSNFNLFLTMEDEKDNFFYIYSALMTVALVIFGSWSWYRLSGILNNYIANPIKHLTNCLKTNESLDKKNNIEEIQFLINEINCWKIKLNKMQEDENAAIIGKVAAQLAHDVRSPLSAIDMLVKNLSNIPENYRITLRNATQRISDIANNFLSQYKNKKPSIDTEIYISNEYIPGILLNMVAEKRSQYADYNINIILTIDDDAWDIFCLINPPAFNRVLSNLINNSIEAIFEKGFINIKLSKLENSSLIEIIDNGCGIEVDLIPKIMLGGVSVGKKNGSGLGLSHAIRKIKDWHGNLEIKSDIGVGTGISINLPLSNQIPLWFGFNLMLYDRPVICILDDEDYTHSLWKSRFNQIPHLFSSINHFYSERNLRDFIFEHTTNLICLIDYDLGMNSLNGLDVIENYNLNNKAILVTNRYDDVEIQERCISLNVKIIPKNLISNISIMAF